MVNVRFKKNSISSYSVYFDVSEKNQKRYYVFLDLVVSKDYYPLFAVQLAKRKNMKISVNDSQKINYIRLKLLEAQLNFAYLLSCFTSLRFSDVSILKWENIQKGRCKN